MIGIVSASPLIYLGKIGALDLLPKLFDKIITTDNVKDEVLQSKFVPERVILEGAFSSWIEIQNPQNNHLLSKLYGLQMHQGEASVLALAKEFIDVNKDPVAVIDDLSAREIARPMGILVIGTTGVLLQATKNKIITFEQAKRFLEKLIKRTKFRISTQLYLKIIKELEGLEKK